jgi:hypothetical protein
VSSGREATDVNNGGFEIVDTSKPYVNYIVDEGPVLSDSGDAAVDAVTLNEPAGNY